MFDCGREKHPKPERFRTMITTIKMVCQIKIPFHRRWPSVEKFDNNNKNSVGGGNLEGGTPSLEQLRNLPHFSKTEG